MTISFDLPADVEASLRHQFSDLDRVAKESALVELYRQDKISQPELSRALGVTRLETEAVLKRHNVTEDLPTNEEIEAALRHLDERLGK